MSEQRFTFDYEVEFEIFDRVTKKHYDGRVGCQEKICDLLNEQQATINELKAKLKEKEEDEQLYANEIVKLNKEAKEVLDFKSLGGDY